MKSMKDLTGTVIFELYFHQPKQDFLVSISNFKMQFNILVR